MSPPPRTDEPGGQTQEIRNLVHEDARRELSAARRERLQARLRSAFGNLPLDSPEHERGQLVRDFLQFVANNVDHYATRTRVTNPHTGEVVDAPWIVLCGATIRALDVPRRIQRLVLELVDGVLPEKDLERRRQLYRAAQMSFSARASAADVRALDKKGMLAAFSGKLLVDSKHLILDHSPEEAEAYFDAARRIGLELQEAPYQTNRDRRFLTLVRERYGGGMESLVDAQRAVTLEEIQKRDAEYPDLEGALRGMLDQPFGMDHRRSLDDWYIAARITFQSDRYVYRRIDEFRRALEARMAELEAEPMLNPEVTREESTGPVASCIAALESTLTDHGATIAPQPEQRLDVMQVVRQNAALLARPELAAYIDGWLSDPDLLEHYARYRVAAFRLVESDLRVSLQQELVLWDELFRSAPLSEEQHRLLAALRDELLAPLRARDAPLPEGLARANMLLPFGQQVLPLLTSEEEFDAFGRWMRRVRAVFEDRAASDDEIPVPDAALARGEATPTPTPSDAEEMADQTGDGAKTARWYPTLIDVAAELDEEAVDTGSTKPPSRPDTGPVDRPARGWLQRWFG